MLEDHNFITPFNSTNFLIGHALYKNNNEELARELIETTEQFNPNINELSQIIYNEVITSSEILQENIERRLVK